MEKAIKDLVDMNDSASLFEIMEDSEDEFLQLDAAEGLLMLGDRRGLDFLSNAKESEDREIREYVKEILDSREVKQVLEDLAADQEKKHQAKLLEGARRLREGKKVFAHKVIALVGSDLADGDEPGVDFKIRRLEDAGLEGWEVVNILAATNGMFAAIPESTVTGAFVLLKKEITPAESAELGLPPGR